MAAIPEITVRAALDTDARTRPGDDDWTTLTDDNPVTNVSFSRGYDQREAQPQTTDLAIRFRNDNGWLDPDNAASPYWPNLGVRRRIQVLVDGEPLVTGWIEDLEPQWNAAGTIAHMSIRAHGILGLIAEDPLELSPIHQAVLDSGPIAYWPFDEAEGRPGDMARVVEDLASNNDGRYRRPVTPIDPGIVPGAGTHNRSQRFGYTDGDFIEQGFRTNPLQGIGNEISIEFWVQVLEEWDPEGNAVALFWVLPPGFPDSNSSSYIEVYLDAPTGHVVFTLQSHTTPPQNLRQAIGTRSLGLNRHHVVYRHGAGSSAAVFVDGEVDTSSSFALGSWDFSQSPAGMRVTIAAFPEASSQQPPLIVSHLAIYNRPLTDDEIAAHYHAGRTGWDGDTTGQRLERILDAIGIDDDGRLVEEGTARCGVTTLDRSLAFEYARRCAATEDGILTEDAEGRVVFRAQLPNAEAPLFTFGPDDNPYTEITPSSGLDRLVTRAEVAREGGATQSRQAASAARNGIRTASRETLHRSAAGARSLAGRLVIRNSEPRTLIRALSINCRDDRIEPELPLTLSVGDQVEVVADRPGVGELAELYTVEALEHELDADLDSWTLTVGLAPFTVLPCFALDDPDAGLDQSVMCEGSP